MMRGIFEAPTVAGAAALIEELRGAERTVGPTPASGIQRLDRRAQDVANRE